MSSKDPIFSDNPLLDLGGLPRFCDIEAAVVEPALDAVLLRNRAQIQVLESGAKEACWDSFAQPLQEMEEELERVWAPVSHLNAVRDSKALRAAVENAEALTEEAAPAAEAEAPGTEAEAPAAEAAEAPAEAAAEEAAAPAEPAADEAAPAEEE